MHSFLRPFSGLLALGVGAAGIWLATDQLWLACLGVIFLCLLYLIGSSVPRQARATARTQGADRDQARHDSLRHSVQLLAGFLLAGFLTLGVHMLRQQVIQGEAIATSRVINETYKVSDGIYQRDTTLLRGGRTITFTRLIQADDLETGTSPLQNPRLLARQLRVQRGRIFDASGRAIADRVVHTTTNGYVQRVYPVPNMSYLAGYYNPTIYGMGGLELNYDRYLHNSLGTNPIVEQEMRLLHRPEVGNDLHLTLVPAIQDAAEKALGPRKGAVVVLDAQTGAVLALVTYPHHDPNRLALNPALDWDTENARIVSYWKEVTSRERSPDEPMLNRATQGLYPPGSTYKTVTMAAGIDLGKVRPDTVFTDTGSIRVDAGGYEHVDCRTCRPPNHPSNLFTLMEGYQWSLNVVFAELAVFMLGPQPDPLVQYSQRFGFGRTYDMGLPESPSTLGTIKTKNDLAATSYGQGQVQASPLQMALVAATVARGGELPRPYLMQRVTGPDGRVIEETRPQTLGRAVSPDSAAILTQMMIISVEKGWANGAKIPGAFVGGKTGTAETGRDTTHAWFIGIAGADAARPQYAVAALVEEGGEGSRVAVPVARAALLAALQGP